MLTLLGSPDFFTDSEAITTNPLMPAGTLAAVRGDNPVPAGWTERTDLKLRVVMWTPPVFMDPALAVATDDEDAAASG